MKKIQHQLILKEINKEIYDDISKREGRYDYNMYNVAKLKWGL